MLKKVLIANRGEIAIRIIRACKELGISTVAVYSTEDKESLHVKLADESICIGQPRSKDSYLNENNILSAAISLKCDGIHPGYGFLSENADFARKVEKENIKFIGPSADIIDMMGDKIEAISLMKKSNVPTVPGSNGEIKTVEEAKEVVERIGLPVLIKASGGGGGRGMRRVFQLENLEKEFLEAKREAKAAFNNDSMYIEKLVLNPKHVEVQILADDYGNVISLGERDCSVQRKNQKLIEESPCSILKEEVREKMYEAAENAAKACNYTNAGTIEFVLSGDDFYFIEMNTRIQVEHPVTEMATGVDLVKEQLKIASGEKLDITREDAKVKRCSIECRINSENPKKNFMPDAGSIDFINVPGGNNVRFDTFLYNGCKISPFYDSMIGKLIVSGDSREETIKKMLVALNELKIEGIVTNKDLQEKILLSEEFESGMYNTSFIENNIEDLIK